ncbi:MAG: hypothetical protein ABTQ73_02995 [Caldilineales bacterium]
MNEQDFELLVESVKQAGEIKRGDRPPSRVFEFSPLDVKAIRGWIDHRGHRAAGRGQLSRVAGITGIV